MPLSKKEAAKRINKKPSKASVDAKLGVMHQCGIPSTFTDQYKQRMLDCKTYGELDRLADIVRHTYFERTWRK